MTRRLLEALIRRPIGVMLVVLAVAVVGLFTLFRIPISAMPGLLRPVVRVTGQAQESMERIDGGLARSLDERLLSIPGADSVTTWSIDGEVASEVAFGWGVGEEEARLLVSESVEGLASEGRTIAWEVFLVEPSARPAVLLAVNGPLGISRRTLVAEDILLPAVAGLPGSGRAEVLGGARERIVVRPDTERLRASGLRLGDIRAAISRGADSRMLGSVILEGEQKGTEIANVVVAPLQEQAAAVEALQVYRPGGGSVPLGELASVRREPWPEHGALLISGAPTVAVGLYLTRGANAIALGRELDKVLGRMGSQLPQGVSIERVIDEPGEMMKAILGLFWAGAIGALIAGIVLAAFARQAASTVVLVAAVPLSILASLPLFFALGVGLNLVSMTGLALASGMLVDASVVVLSACCSRQGKLASRILDGTSSVARAIFASTITTAIVFLPALYIRNLAAGLFRQLALALMLTLVMSLPFALFAVPVAASRLFPLDPVRETRLDRAYRRLLTRIMGGGRWSAISVASAAIIFAAFIALLPQRLLPPEEGTAMEIDFNFAVDANGARLARMAHALREAGSGRLDSGKPDVLAIGLVGRSGPPLPAGFWRVEGPRSREEIEALKTAILSRLPGACISSAGTVGGVLDALPLRPLSIDISGLERQSISQEAGRLTAFFSGKGLPCLTDLPPAVPCFEMHPLPRGLSSASRLFDQVSISLPSVESPSPWFLRLEEPLPEPSGLGGLAVAEPDGSLSPAGSAADFKKVYRSAALVHHQGEPAIRLLLGESTSEVKGIEALASEAARSSPSGVAARLSGGALDWQEARGELFFAASLGILLVFLVLSATYESFVLPLIIFSVLPFAGLGGAMTLLLSGQGLNLASGLGMVLLCGLAINNGVFLVDSLNGRPGGPARWALHASRRLRPVLVTTLTTLATLAPVAFSGGAGASMRSALSLTVFAGLFLSTPAALFLVPPLARLVLAGRVDPGGAGR